MEKTKIDWCDSTWNPVSGCLHECPYCYARSMAERFSGIKLGKGTEAGWGIVTLNEPYVSAEGKRLPYPYGFFPTFHRYRLGDYKDKAGRNIFVCSMADLFGEWVPDERIKEVFDACKASPQHNYIFLTKNPGRYERLWAAGLLPDLDNMWYGQSVTNRAQKGTAKMPPTVNAFLSIEPLLEDLGDFGWNGLTDPPDWVIIGAETGNRRGKVKPKKAWVMSIVYQCRSFGIPVFMKESLREIMGAEFLQEFPGQLHWVLKNGKMARRELRR